MDLNTEGKVCKTVNFHFWSQFGSCSIVAWKMIHWLWFFHNSLPKPQTSVYPFYVTDHNKLHCNERRKNIQGFSDFFSSSSFSTFVGPSYVETQCVPTTSFFILYSSFHNNLRSANLDRICLNIKLEYNKMLSINSHLDLGLDFDRTNKAHITPLSESFSTHISCLRNVP